VSFLSQTKLKSATAEAAAQKTQTPIVAKQIASESTKICNSQLCVEFAFLSNSKS